MFADLDETEFGGAPASTEAKPAKARPTFPCQSCAGSGLYRAPRVHQEKAECFPCGGRGFFYSSHADRMKNRAAAAKRKQSKLEVAQEAFNALNEGFIAVLAEMTSWNDFARNLMEQYKTKGALSENQVSAIYRMKAKADETRAAKQAARSSVSATVDLSSIHAMFDRAKASGLKKPAYRAEGLVLSLAKEGSANFGSIYVKRASGEYIGKVTGSDFRATSDAKAEDKDTLQKIAANPSQVAKDYGKRVGICSCCGRELTDPNSIAAGIGPICAEGWGF